MKNVRSNEYNVLTARVFLGALFVIASIDKIADPAAFAQSIQNYRILAGPSLTFLATIIPWMELLAGLCLLGGVLLRGSSLLTGTLLVIFTGSVISALVRGLDISCGCFTQDPGTSTIGWFKIVENIVLTGVSIFLYYSDTSGFSLEGYLQRTQVQTTRRDETITS